MLVEHISYYDKSESKLDPSNVMQWPKKIIDLYLYIIRFIYNLIQRLIIYIYIYI